MQFSGHFELTIRCMFVILAPRLWKKQREEARITAICKKSNHMLSAQLTLTDLYTRWVKKTRTRTTFFSGKASSKSTDVGTFWHRQLHIISSSAFASNKFAVENHLQFPWQRQQTYGRWGLTVNRRLSTKWSTGGENDSGPLWRPNENTLFEHLLWSAVAYCLLLRRIVSNSI